jgi:hypothetical protein
MQSIAVCDPLTPDLAYCEKIRSEVGEGPIITLNLVRFRRDGGREKFDDYARISGPLLEKARADLLFLGNAGPLVAGRAGDEEWDLVAVVRFANIDRFLAMITDPTYQIEGRRLREESLERVIWLVTFPV